MRNRIWSQGFKKETKLSCILSFVLFFIIVLCIFKRAARCLYPHLLPFRHCTNEQCKSSHLDLHCLPGLEC